jgi:hypothetical protein
MGFEVQLDYSKSCFTSTCWSPGEDYVVLFCASLLAMVVNDNVCELDKRAALESIAGKPAPTVSR